MQDILSKYKEGFLALEEYDRTGILPLVEGKRRVDITLSRSILAKFKAKLRGKALSTEIERLICKELGTT